MQNNKVIIGLISVLSLFAIIGYIQDKDSDRSLTNSTYTLYGIDVNKKESKSIKKDDDTNNYDSVNDSRKSAAKTSTLMFIDTIEYYSAYASIDTENYVQLSGSLTCIYNGYEWETDDCTKFFNETNGVLSKSKIKLPTKATIILDSNGKVQSNTEMTFYGYTCTYDGNDITECKK